LGFLGLTLTACGGAWHQVPVNVNPAAIADPVTEMKTLLNMLQFPPALTEVTDQYVKAVWPTVVPGSTASPAVSK
jgi:hypothetical protein